MEEIIGAILADIALILILILKRRTGIKRPTARRKRRKKVDK